MRIDFVNSSSSKVTDKALVHLIVSDLGFTQAIGRQMAVHGAIHIYLFFTFCLSIYFYIYHLLIYVLISTTIYGMKVFVWLLAELK